MESAFIWTMLSRKEVYANHPTIMLAKDLFMRIFLAVEHMQPTDKWTLENIAKVSPFYRIDIKDFCPRIAIETAFLQMFQCLSLKTTGTDVEDECINTYIQRRESKNIAMPFTLPPEPFTVESHPFHEGEYQWILRGWAVNVSAFWLSQPERPANAKQSDTSSLQELDLPYGKVLELLLGQTYSKKRIAKNLLSQRTAYHTSITYIIMRDTDDIDLTFMLNNNLFEANVTLETGYERTENLTVHQVIKVLTDQIENTEKYWTFVQSWNDSTSLLRLNNNQSFSTCAILSEYAEANFVQRIGIRLKTGVLAKPHMKTKVIFHIQAENHTLMLDSKLLTIQELRYIIEFMRLAVMTEPNEMDENFSYFTSLNYAKQYFTVQPETFFNYEGDSDDSSDED